jgi:filamentous hemagglutinin
MTQTTYQKLVLWLPLFFIAFYTFFQINKTNIKPTYTNIKGANIHATQSTNLDVGGDLNIESLQDRHKEKTLGVNVSAGFADTTDSKGISTGTTTNTGSLSANQNKGNYQAVTNQTSITGNTVNINTKGNTHLKGVVVAGEEATSITTATLSTENIENKASYSSLSGGVSYSNITSKKDEPTVANNQSNQEEDQRSKGVTPDIGLPQDKEKTSTTHTAIADNTVINITDQANQSQNTDNISRDVDKASFTMTEINTEVLEIRSEIAKDVAVDGFKAVGDYAMEQAAAGDEAWEDGGIKKTLAHAAMGATVAAIGNGDALGGALGAGAREAVSGATKDEDDATQQVVSSLIGAAAGGGTGASVALDGEKYNRQLHQKEIAWIDKNAQAYADANGLTKEQAITALTEQGLRGVDKGWSLKLGSEADKNAQAFLDASDQDLFKTKSDSEFYNATITRYGDTTTKIKDLSQENKDKLKDFYKDNVKNASSENLKDLYIKDLKTRGVENAEEMWENIKKTPEGLEALYTYLKDTPAEQIAKDAKDGGRAIVEGVKDTLKEGTVASTASGEIARNEDGTADLLNELYDDDTAATASRLMVDEDLFEAVTLVGGVAKGVVTGIKKLGNGKVEVTLENGKTAEIPEDVAYDNKGIYDPKAAEEYLNDKYGAENVSSTTLPKNAQQASSDRPDVIVGDDGAKSVQIVQEDGTIKYIPYDNRDLPIFDDVSKYTTNIKKPDGYENMTPKARRAAEMRAATRQLREDINSGKVDVSQFTEKQINAINKGKDKVPGLTWHHNAQSSPNNIQLVPENIHNTKDGKGVPHTGEGSMNK